MADMRARRISVLGVPMDLGADRRGVDMGPSAIRCAGLVERLTELGFEVQDEGDLVIRRRADGRTTKGTRLKYLPEIVRANSRLADRVEAVMREGRMPIVLGGDHSIAIGTIAGVTRCVGKLGVIWLDAHGDLNTADTTPSGNIHGMALASALGYGHPKLTAIAGKARAPGLLPERVAMVGTRSLDPGERAFLKEQGIALFTMHEIDRYGIAEVMERAMHHAGAGADGVHLSLDLDGLDPQETPGVGTPVAGGLSFREGNLAMEMLAAAGLLVSAEFVEVNPTLDVRNRTAEAAVELIASALGETIL